MELDDEDMALVCSVATAPVEEEDQRGLKRTATTEELARDFTMMFDMKRLKLHEEQCGSELFMQPQASFDMFAWDQQLCCITAENTTKAVDMAAQSMTELNDSIFVPPLSCLHQIESCMLLQAPWGAQL